MGKKKVKNDFNMSAEIRNLLKSKRTLSGKEVYDSLVKNFPKQKINKGSCLVAFSKNRERMGLKKKAKKSSVGKKTVKRKKPTSIDLNSLQAAAKFVAQIGSAEKAIAAIKQLESVQIR